MAQYDGRLIECCRCHIQIFIKHIGHDDLDGGFTRIEKFEAKPAGWTRSLELKSSDLCPACSAEWERTKKAFMQRPIEKA